MLLMVEQDRSNTRKIGTTYKGWNTYAVEDRYHSTNCECSHRYFHVGVGLAAFKLSRIPWSTDESVASRYGWRFRSSCSWLNRTFLAETMGAVLWLGTTKSTEYGRPYHASISRVGTWISLLSLVAGIRWVDCLRARASRMVDLWVTSLG